MFVNRKKTRVVNIGDILIGGENPISIQSMTTTDTHNITTTLAQINALKDAGADIVRIAVLNERDGKALATLVEQSPVPLVADIHYNANLALAALNARISGLRLNPGNISEPEKIKEIVKKAKEYNPTIRIGVNAGSLDITKYPEPTPENMVLSALDHIKILEDLNYPFIKVSLKASDVLRTVEANRLFSTKRDYPIHLGITEAGDEFSSSIRSSVGLGALLMEGIGDTIRISVSGDPIVEPKIAKEILLSLNLTKGLHIIGCPTCGRKNLDVNMIIQKIRSKFDQPINKNISIAIMGCLVNGFGEALHADIGIVGIHGAHEIHIKGKLHKKLSAHIKEEDIVEEITPIIKSLLNGEL